MTDFCLDIVTPADFSFGETVAAHGWRRLAPFVWHEDTQVLERVEELPQGRLVHLRMQENEGCVHVDMMGDANEQDADEIARRVRLMLQLEVSLAEFHAYCAAHPRLAHMNACRRGRMLRAPTLFEDAVKVIATTNTTWTQTVAMVARLVKHFGSEGIAFPNPARIASVPQDEFAANARMGYRSAYIHSLAISVAEGRLDLEGWQSGNLAAVELRKRLLSLPGVGPYGAACLMLYLGKPQHVNSDSVARAKVARELGRAVTDKEVHAFFEAHGEWQGLAYQFWPWQSPAD